MNDPDELNLLEQKIKDFKEREFHARHHVKPAETDYSRTAVGFQISTELLAGVLIGAGIGYLTDKFFSTHPWFIALFTILGGAGGLLSIYRTFKAEEKSKE